MSKNSKQGKDISETNKTTLKKLGEGSYGCVVSHPLKCSEKEDIITKNIDKDRKLIGKLFYSREYYNDEVKLGKIVKSIDPSGKKMLAPVSGCAVSKKILENPNNIKAISKCEAITNTDKYSLINDTDSDVEFPNKVWQLKMPYAGLDMHSYLEKYKNGVTVKSLMSTMIPLFESVILLKQHKLVHQDIKPDNVLIYKKKTVLIDYSLMLPFEDIYTMKNYSRLKSHYRYYPFEYYLTSLVFKYNTNISMKKDDLVYYIMEKYRDYIIKKAHHLHPYYTVDELLEHATEYDLLSIIMKNPKNMKEYVDKIDIYSIGITIKELTRYIKPNTMTNEFINFVRNILHPDPRKRISAEDALNICKKLSN